MNNYRIEFGFGHTTSIGQGPNYFYDTIRHIKQMAIQADITNIWFFYEPHVEITWLSDNDTKSKLLMKEITRYLCSMNCFETIKMKYPEDGEFADWWGKTKEENEFGAKVHCLCSDFVDLYNNYKKEVDTGKGLRSQVERTIHRLCNPLGIDYLEEAKICFSRGLICLLFTLFSFNKAVWIYRNIFRQPY